MDPVSYKIWRYLLITADYTTGTLTTTLSQIADGVEWTARGCPRRPNKKTISVALAAFKRDNMIDYMVSGRSNAKYTKVTICNYETYNSAAPIEVTQNGSSLRSTRSTRIKNPLPTDESVGSQTAAQANGKAPRKSTYNPANPWHRDVNRICVWFYKQDGRYQPTSDAAKDAILNEVRLIFEKDMAGTPETERATRLETLLEAIVEDEFWSQNVLSLAGLRKRKTPGAPPKWLVAERKLIGVYA
jgi:hypothetical protein